MMLNSKHRTEKTKSKNQINRNMKNQNTERRKPSFTGRIGRKCTNYNFVAQIIPNLVRFVESG